MINHVLNAAQGDHKDALKPDDIRNEIREWMEKEKLSFHVAAKTLGVNKVAFDSYIEERGGFSRQLVESKWNAFSRRQEDFRVGRRENIASPFVMTGPAHELWTILQYAQENACIAVGSACSGIGKTATVCAYVDASEPEAILITADLTLRRATNMIRVLSGRLGTGWRYTSSDRLDIIINRLKGSGQLLVVDDCHFLSWECLEILRKIHDLAHIGIAFIGQERLYDEMRGAKGYLFDQLFSRVAIRRDLQKIEREDVKLISTSMYPDGLDKRSVDFLFAKAQDQGRFRPMVSILKLAIKEHLKSGDPVDLEMLTGAADFLEI
jgi:DNA transposition AAA+ family ATPase